MDNPKPQGHSEALLKALDETRNTNRGPFFWPHIYDSETAKASARLGVVGASLAVAMSIAGAISNSNIIFLVQALVFGVIGYGIYRTSRIAAWLGLCLVPFSKAPFHLSIATVFFLITPFINGVRGAMAYTVTRKIHCRARFRVQLGKLLEKGLAKIYWFIPYCSFCSAMLSFK